MSTCVASILWDHGFLYSYVSRLLPPRLPLVFRETTWGRRRPSALHICMSMMMTWGLLACFMQHLLNSSTCWRYLILLYPHLRKTWSPASQLFWASVGPLHYFWIIRPTICTIAYSMLFHVTCLLEAQEASAFMRARSHLVIIKQNILPLRTDRQINGLAPRLRWAIRNGSDGHQQPRHLPVSRSVQEHLTGRVSFHFVRNVSGFVCACGKDGHRRVQ